MRTNNFHGKGTVGEKSSTHHFRFWSHDFFLFLGLFPENLPGVRGVAHVKLNIGGDPDQKLKNILGGGGGLWEKNLQ